MPIEIERKFLLANDGWRELSVRSERLKDGLLIASDAHKVRVRLYEKRATLTIKSRTQGIARAEYEYEIPFSDAEELLSLRCGPNILEKTRYYVPYEGFTWEVDVYEGLLDGVVLAEVELNHADIEIPMPVWIGREVTGLPEFKKINMLKARLG